MTAQDIVNRIKEKLAAANIAWRAQTVDTFKAGDPNTTQIRGITTTGMATFDLLKRVAPTGRNFIIGHEPVFYNHMDVTTSLESDVVYQAKQKFIKDNNLVLFRFHDHAHALSPDPLVVGSARTLGLTQYAQPGTNGRIYVIPKTTLRAFATDIAKRLGARNIRVVGNPDASISRIVLGPGYSSVNLGPDADVAICGENAESGGNVEYVLDATALGQPKASIYLGHMMSEDWGMQEVATWLRTFITDLPIEWTPAHEPFAPVTDCT